MENLYAVLGVRNEATLAEIKKAYREKVKNLHPDSTGKSADNEEFSRVVHAYRVLSDSHQRSIFDDSYFIKIRREKKSYDSFACRYLPHAYAQAQAQRRSLQSFKADERGRKW